MRLAEDSALGQRISRRHATLALVCLSKTSLNLITPSAWNLFAARCERQGMRAIPVALDTGDLLQSIGSIAWIDANRSGSNRWDQVIAACRGRRGTATSGAKPAFPAKASRGAKVASDRGAVSNLPRRRVIDLAGREPLLERLIETTARNPQTAIVESIAGIGGTGKSALALELCYRLAKEVARCMVDRRVIRIVAVPVYRSYSGRCSQARRTQVHRERVPTMVRVYLTQVASRSGQSAGASRYELVAPAR